MPNHHETTQLKRVAYFDSLVQDLAARVKALGAGEQLLILLEGDLGVGKTQLTKELLAHFSYDHHQVQSPTFLKLIEHGVAGVGKVLHLDCYRLDTVAEVERLDLESYENQKLMIVEWPKLFVEYLRQRPQLKSSLGITQIVQAELFMDVAGNRNWVVSELEI